MKTASIDIYQIFLSRGGIAVDIRYRGKLIASFEGLILDEVLSLARIWSRNRGFTHLKINYELPAIKRICTVQA